MFLKECLIKALFSSAPSSDLSGCNKGEWLYLWWNINLHSLDANILRVCHLVNICVADLQMEMVMEGERWCEGLHVVKLEGWEGTRVGTRVGWDPISCIRQTRGAVRRVTGAVRGVCLLVVTRVFVHWLCYCWSLPFSCWLRLDAFTAFEPPLLSRCGVLIQAMHHL